MSASSSSSSSSSTDLGDAAIVEVQCGDRKVSVPTNLFINGKFTQSLEKQRFATLNPATEQVIAEVAEARKEDVDVAVKAARAAFGPWRDAGPSAHEAVLLKIVELLKRDADDIAALEALDNGKPFGIAKTADVPLVIQTLQYFAGWCDKITGDTYGSSVDKFNMTLREPIGVCGAVIPWNFPLLMLAWKVGPALAAGNVMVLKSAEQTPLSALKFAQICAEAGVPPGVLNIISGFGPTAGAALAEHMDVDKIAFTGSTNVGRIIMKAAAASNLKKVSLELGGKSPVVVFADADLDQAVQQCLAGICFNSGQVCTAGSRVFVSSNVHDEFVAKYREAVKGWSVGNQFDNVMQGPQVSKAQFDIIMGYIEKGKAEGATLLCGGGRVGDKGYFIEPTAFTDVADDMTIAREEIFGPVVAIFKFDEANVDEIIRRANDTPYGLAAAVFSKDVRRVMQLVRSISAGTVWVNCEQVFSANLPFGGFKQSGIGRELGLEGMLAYTEVKSVRMNLNF